MSLHNKVIWITGASSGIGEALTHALVAKNSRLIISARNEAALQAIKANYPAAQIEVVPFDLLARFNSEYSESNPGPKRPLRNCANRSKKASSALFP